MLTNTFVGKSAERAKERLLLDKSQAYAAYIDIVSAIKDTVPDFKIYFEGRQTDFGRGRGPEEQLEFLLENPEVGLFPRDVATISIVIGVHKAILYTKSEPALPLVTVLEFIHPIDKGAVTFAEAVIDSSNRPLQIIGQYVEPDGERIDLAMDNFDQWRDDGPEIDFVELDLSINQLQSV